MNIALIGYGKMGKMIEEIALQRSHKILLKIDKDNYQDFTSGKLNDINVAIEFTGPDTAYDNVKKSIDFGIPVVSGSTGWNEKLNDIKNYCLENNGTFLHASNFSIGVNIFFEINKKLASLMSSHEQYEVSLKEIHHTEKKDAPSGTAVTLAEQILENNTHKKYWTKGESPDKHTIPIYSERTDPAPGTHYVKYSSDIDDIEIIHTAHNRRGFALGAVLAAEFIFDKKGVFTMADVLKIS